MDLEARVEELKAKNKHDGLLFMAGELGIEGVDKSMNKTALATAIAEHEALEATSSEPRESEPAPPPPRKTRVPQVVEGAYVPTRQIRYQPKGGGEVKTQPAQLVTMVRRGGKEVAERRPNVRRDISPADVNAFLKVDAIRPHMV